MENEKELLLLTLKSVLPFLKKSTDLSDPFCAIMTSPAQQMRQAADRIEKQDAIIQQARDIFAQFSREGTSK